MPTEFEEQIAEKLLKLEMSMRNHFIADENEAKNITESLIRISEQLTQLFTTVNIFQMELIELRKKVCSFETHPNI